MVLTTAWKSLSGRGGGHRQVRAFSKSGGFPIPMHSPQNSSSGMSLYVSSAPMKLAASSPRLGLSQLTAVTLLMPF